MLSPFFKIFMTLILTAVSIDTTGECQETDASKFSIADTRKQIAGQWEGKLEYRDYQADRWFGIPLKVDVELIKDGTTVIRKAEFDDGASGTVYITNVSMFSADGKTEYVGSYRADRPAEMGEFSLRLTENNNGKAQDSTHWTVIAERKGKDDNRPAMIRETTIRDGSRLTTFKEVNFTDDDKDQWLKRNRTVLQKVAEE